MVPCLSALDVDRQVATSAPAACCVANQATAPRHQQCTEQSLLIECVCCCCQLHHYLKNASHLLNLLLLQAKEAQLRQKVNVRWDVGLNKKHLAHFTFARDDASELRLMTGELPGSIHGLLYIVSFAS